MKAIALCGSARLRGNTEMLLNACIETLTAHGIEGELVRLSELDLRPCTACTQCFQRKDGRCIQKDDFNDLFAKMREADIIVMGSPVYFGSASANMKILMDRAGYVARANGNIFARKLGGPITVARRAGENFTYAQMLFWYMIMDMIVPGSTYWNVAHALEPATVGADTEGMETIRHFAENLAWLAEKTRTE